MDEKISINENPIFKTIFNTAFLLLASEPIVLETRSLPVSVVLIRRLKYHVTGLDLGHLGENATLGNAWTRQCRNKFNSKSLWWPPMPPTMW